MQRFTFPFFLLLVAACGSEDDTNGPVSAAPGDSVEESPILSSEESFQSRSLQTSQDRVPSKEEQVLLEKAAEFLASMEATGDDYDDSSEYERAVERTRSPTFVNNGFNAFATGPEVVSMEVIRPSGVTSSCSAITLTDRYLVTAAHCFVPTCFGTCTNCVNQRCQDLVQLTSALPPLFLPPPQREGAVDIEVRLTTSTSQSNVLVHRGAATFIVHQLWTPDGANNDEPDHDIALVRTSVAMPSIVRGRLYATTAPMSTNHTIVGWAALNADSNPGLPPTKTAGTMNFGAWNSWEGLKLNVPSSGVTGTNGDSGGGAFVPRVTTSGSRPLYDGIASGRVVGSLFPGNTFARTPYKLGWISNTASVRLGPQLTFTTFTTTDASPVTYVRAAGSGS